MLLRGAALFIGVFESGAAPDHKCISCFEPDVCLIDSHFFAFVAFASFNATWSELDLAMYTFLPSISL